MTGQLMLDTNNYYLFFHRPKSPSYFNLESRLKSGQTMEFFVSEITSLEIHSVLGKYRRRGPAQNQRCDRMVIVDGREKPCQNEWVVPRKIRLSRRLFHDIQKVVNNIEACKGVVKANVLPLTTDAILEGRRLLMLYADRYNFGSHDALIAGSFIFRRRTNRGLVLATSDRGFKAVLKAETLPYYDPNIVS